MNCATCVHWRAKDREHDYLGYCFTHKVYVEFNMGCPQFKNTILPVGTTLSPDKLNGGVGYHPSVDMYNGLTKEEYFKDIT